MTISPAQDAWIEYLRKSRGLKRSQVVQMALDKLMGDPTFSLTAFRPEKTEKAS